MKVLGIDSSGLVASVAVVEDDILLAEYTVNYKKTHSQTLLPMLKEIGDMINLDLNSLDAIVLVLPRQKVWGWHLTNRSYRFRR